jgi:rSAM/selenodomain-associated transferase 2
LAERDGFCHFAANEAAGAQHVCGGQPASGRHAAIGAEVTPSGAPLPPGVLDVIVPTLNAAAGLHATLASLAVLGARVIVVDGGSDDTTASVARASGAVLLTAPPGRGFQLARGAAAATAPWLLFLHADTVLGAGAAAEIAAFIASSGGDRAGYFHLRLDDAAPAARRLERLVDWRCRIFALPYGDQGLLIPAALYQAVGGFADIPLMEDVELVRRLGRGRLHRLATSVETSAARYRGDGYLRRPARNLFLLFLYLCGVRPARLVRLYAGRPSQRR